MVKIKEMLAPLGSACRTGYKRAGMIGVTIHETANTSKGAGASNHASYLQNTGQYDSVSWHYAVDDKLITRSIPESECAWHAGDGRTGNGNSRTIAIEICVNSDSDYKTACKNAAELSADILRRYGFESAYEALFTHSDWMKKNCPANMLSQNKWYEFNDMVQKFLNDKLPKPGHKPDFKVYVSISGHLTAADAIKNVNKKNTVAPGFYYVYKEVAGAINVTGIIDKPGSWIDAQKNARTHLGEIKVGDIVALNGYVYADSYGNGKSQEHYKRTGKITKVSDMDRVYPYHFDTLGWIGPDSIDVVSGGNNPSGDFQVSDTVKIKTSALKYSRSTVSIPAMYKDKPFTIQQVGENDVLLKELYSWVNKNDVSKISTGIIFKTGDKIKIKTSALKYSRSTVSIPAMYKDKSFTIQQVDENDVLLKELYSWVNKNDVSKI